MLHKLTTDVFNARLAQANLMTKTDFDAKFSSLNRKITQNKSKHLLVENELNKLKTFDSSYFIGKSHPALNYYGTKTRVKFTGSCFKQSRISCNHGKVVNIYIVYELGSSRPTLKNCLFGAAALTKNADIDKYGYSKYGIGFDRRGNFCICRWWIWSKHINFWSRYDFFCSY